MESLKVKDIFNDIYIEKCKNAQECEDKLRELISVSGLDIDFDIDNEEAYLNLPHKRLKMKKGRGDVYYIQYDNKIIGIEFKGSWACLGFSIDLEVFISEGNNFQSYQYKQNYFNNGAPWFYYNDYIDGVAHEFACNGHMAHFRDANAMMRDTLGILNSWGIEAKNKRKKLNYHEFAFGGTEEQIGYDENGKSKFIHIPTVSSININKGNCEEHSLIVDHIVQLYEVKSRYFYKNQDGGLLVPSYDHTESKYIDPKNAIKTFDIEDPELMKFCINILRQPCNKKIFKENKEYLSNLPVYKYISKYYQDLVNGIEYYQNLENYEQTEDIAKNLNLRDNPKRIGG